MQKQDQHRILLLVALFCMTFGHQAASGAIIHHKKYLPYHYVARGTKIRKVSLNFNHAPIRVVLQVLFRRGGKDYVLGSGVSGVTTLVLHNVSFATALHEVISVNSMPLTIVMKGRVYVIKGKARKYFKRRYRGTRVTPTKSAQGSKKKSYSAYHRKSYAYKRAVRQR